jgi:organic hydroperoxide reductase OsmC/OhrA
MGKMTSPEQQRSRPRQYKYETSVKWSGEKIGVLSSGEKPSLTVSSPPEFKGTRGLWTPEDMFVGSLELCHLLTFLALAAKRGLSIISYESNAEGTLELIDGAFRFTRVVISPVVVVPAGIVETDVLETFRLSHKQCLISNSVTAVVDMIPKIVQEPVTEEV